MASSRGSISVVIPTRDRGGLVTGAVSTAMAGNLVPAEVLVVDQSRGPETRIALEAWGERAEVRHIASEDVGISSGLNVGIRATSSDLIAITGDDCEVSPDWLVRIVAEFEASPEVGVIFGAIRPHASPDEAGFNPSYEPPGRVTIRHPRDRYRIGGTTACMGLRRELWRAIGGFDEVLGVGAAFGAAEDADFAIRALRRGWHVLEAPDIVVVHFGRIAWNDRAAMIERNWFGTGAALAKPVRDGQPGAWITLARLGGRWIFGRSRIARGLGAGPHRLATAAAFARGFWRGLRRPLDEEGLFKRDASEDAAP